LPTEKEVHSTAWLFNFKYIQLILKWWYRIAQSLHLIYAVSMYINEDLWHPWKASLVPSGISGICG
jgi:hypothetical protein